MAEKQKRKINSKAVFNVFWEHTKRHPWLFGIAVGAGVVTEVANITAPLFTKQLFDGLATANPQTVDVMVLLTPLFWYAINRLVSRAAVQVDSWFGYRLVSEVGKELTNVAFKKLIGHSYSFFANSFSGALVRRVTRFSGSYENLYYAIVDSLGQSALYIIGVLVVLFFYNVLLGAIVIGWVIVFIALQWLLSKIQQPLRLARSEQDTQVGATLADAISNQNTIALFSASRYEGGLVNLATEKLRLANMRLNKIDTFVSGAQGLLTIALNVGMLYVGVLLWQKGLFSLGGLVLVQSYVNGIFSEVWSVGRQFRIINNSLADATEMVENIETPYEVADKPKAKKLKVSTGEIWFDDVSFYFNEQKSVLSNYNLKIAGGEKVALVGPSGAGKTTVTKLLLRLYDVKKGAIVIDGQKIDAVTQDSLREAIGFVPQEPILFHRSLMENIRYGRRDATDAEVIEAAKQAHCHEFIAATPQGYDTLVGERGIKLSGGERQRVAIARAILKDAPILVLDEATSSLDSESEAYIQDALATLMRGKTVVVIAHRLSTIMKMDRIVVMEEGAIVAQGTHLELVNQPGLYQKLWSIQAGGFLGDGDQNDAEGSMNEEKTDELAATEGEE